MVVVADKTDLGDVLVNVLQHDDILLMQGAGDLGALAVDLASKGLPTEIKRTSSESTLEEN